MQKKGFTIIEVIVVFLLMLGVTFLVLPRSLDNTKQARLISKWTKTYSEVEYMFSVIKAQRESEIKERILVAKDNDVRKEIILEAIKPYLRIESEVEPGYKQYFMNGVIVNSKGRYYFNKFYKTMSDEIIGVKWINADCGEGEACAIINFDVNGKAEPNTWGYDVFGINIYKDGNIEPIGKSINPELLREDCSKYGFGVFCSYYYLIGGKFD